MFDTSIRRQIDPCLDRFARLLVKLGFRADAVTIGGFVVGMAACTAIANHWYWAALACIAVNRLTDGLDGAIARQTRSTDVGGYLDILLDMIFYSGVPFAFAVGHPEFTLPAAFLIYSFVGTGGSFLAFAVISAKRGVVQDTEGKKSFYYSLGFMEGTETIVFFVLFCLFPNQFAVLAWVFGGLCWLTTTLRIIVAVRAFREPCEEKAS
jgi:phosphatidylglycerophosphate synthase